MAGASVAGLAPIVLLSLLFSESENDVGSRAAMLVLFVAFALAAPVALLGIERWKRLSQTGCRCSSAQWCWLEAYRPRSSGRGPRT